jgi:hypothetical protein
MAQLQIGTNKGWIIFISNPRWNAWIGKRKELRLQLVTDWPTTKPWPHTFSISGDSKILSTTDASVEFINSVADASKVEIRDDNGALWATADMKDSAATIRAIVNCVREHPPKSSEPEKTEPETTISGTGFLRCTKARGNEQSRREWMHKRHSSAVSRREAVYSNNIRSRRHK